MFGGVAILVGAFTIFNTLSITVAQRTRELGLLRMVGAARRQVLGSVLVEALAIGVLASVVGLVAGLGLAKALDALFDAMELSLPEAGTVFATRTIVVSLLVGTVVTLARRPAAGLARDARAPRSRRCAPPTPGAGRVRLPSRAVRAMASLLGRPAQAVGGAAGGLARRNAMRQPGRTMTTATALTIGVALVTLVTVVAAGLKDTTRGSLEDRIAAEHVVTGRRRLVADRPGDRAGARRTPAWTSRRSTRTARSRSARRRPSTRSAATAGASTGCRATTPWPPASATTARSSTRAGRRSTASRSATRSR